MGEVGAAAGMLIQPAVMTFCAEQPLEERTYSRAPKDPLNAGMAHLKWIKVIDDAVQALVQKIVKGVDVWADELCEGLRNAVSTCKAPLHTTTLLYSEEARITADLDPAIWSLRDSKTARSPTAVKAETE